MKTDSFNKQLKPFELNPKTLNFDVKVKDPKSGLNKYKFMTREGVPIIDFQTKQKSETSFQGTALQHKSNFHQKAAISSGFKGQNGKDVNNEINAYFTNQRNNKRQ